MTDLPAAIQALQIAVTGLPSYPSRYTTGSTSRKSIHDLHSIPAKPTQLQQQGTLQVTQGNDLAALPNQMSCSMSKECEIIGIGQRVAQNAPTTPNGTDDGGIVFR